MARTRMIYEGQIQPTKTGYGLVITISARDNNSRWTSGLAPLESENYEDAKVEAVAMANRLIKVLEG